MRDKAKKLTTLFILATAFLPALVLAYKSPGRPVGFVNDFAGILSAQTKTVLEDEILVLEKQTGHELAVVTVPSLGGDTIENFSVELYKEWGLGKKGADNGVLLLVAPNEREVRIEVGYGLEGVLPDLLVSRIIKDVIIPAFATGDFDGGVLAGVSKIKQIILGEVIDLPEKRRSGLFEFSGDFFFFLIFIFLWLSSVLGASKSWWVGGVVGGVAGVIIGFIKGFMFGLIAFVVLVPLGLLFDFLVSRAYARSRAQGHRPPWFFGGFGGGRGGGFGGFGGGLSGGGGASGRW
jgi:uncharacterized protein